jgi:AcrR family transcriptional regulator
MEIQAVAFVSETPSPARRPKKSGSAPRSPASRRVKTATKDAALIRDRREQLIRAAIKVFGEKGFHRTTVRDIGRAARLTQGTIYNYVRSKEDILFLVCDRVVTEYQHSVRRALSGNGGATERLAEALRGIVRVMIERQTTILLLYHESHNLDRRSLRVILARVDEFIASFERLLAEADREHPMPSRDFRLAANIVTYLPTIVALRRWALPHRIPREKLINEVVDFMLRGLGLGQATQKTYPRNTPSDKVPPVSR